MQLYVGMDIGTAKVPYAEREGVPHHLLDVWPIAKSAAVAEYQTPRPAGDQRYRAARTAADPRRRVRALPARRAGPARLPGRSRRTIRARLSDELAALGAGHAARPARRARPGGRGRDPADATGAASSAHWRSSRSPAGRSAPGCPPSSPSTTACSSGSIASTSMSGSRSGSSACWPPASSRRSAACCSAGLRDQPDSREGARLRATARLPGRRRFGGRRPDGRCGAGRRADRARHASLRPPPTIVVSARPPSAVAGLGATRAGRPGRHYPGRMRLVKGHGTENDFLVLPDLDASIDLTPGLVRALCDRHAGLGADGVLRVVRSDNHPEAKEMAADAPYFMDYRNADGSRRRDVRQRNSGVSAVPHRRLRSLDRQRRWRHAAGSDACGLAATETSLWKWASPGSLPTGRSPPPPSRPLGHRAHHRHRGRDAEPARRGVRSTPTTNSPRSTCGSRQSSRRRCPNGQNVEFVRPPRRPAPAAASARARRGGDPLVRHRDLCGSRGRRPPRRTGADGGAWRVDVAGRQLRRAVACRR